MDVNGKINLTATLYSGPQIGYLSSVAMPKFILLGNIMKYDLCAASLLCCPVVMTVTGGDHLLPSEEETL